MTSNDITKQIEKVTLANPNNKPTTDGDTAMSDLRPKYHDFKRDFTKQHPQPDDWVPTPEKPKWCVHHGPCKHEATETKQCDWAWRESEKAAGNPDPIKARKRAKQDAAYEKQMQGYQKIRAEMYMLKSIMVEQAKFTNKADTLPLAFRPRAVRKDTSKRKNSEDSRNDRRERDI